MLFIFVQELKYFGGMPCPGFSWWLGCCENHCWLRAGCVCSQHRDSRISHPLCQGPKSPVQVYLHSSFWK